MSDPNCTQCQEWELCPFHAPDDAEAEDCAETQRATDAGYSCPCTGGPEECLTRGCDLRGLRLLGLDDPEVSDDLIYATPTGGVVALPRRAGA